MASEETKIKITQEQFREALQKPDVVFKDAIFEFPISFVFVQKTSVSQSLNFTNCDFEKIEFQNVLFSNRILFQSCRILNDFTANNCNFDHPFRAYHISARNIIFWDNKIANGFELYNFEKVGELTLQFLKVSKKIVIKQWHVNPIKLEKIHVLFQSIVESSIHIEDLVSKKVEIELSRQMLSDSVWIGSIKTDEFKLINLKNKASNKIEIIGIQAWKTYFIWLHNDGLLSLRDFNRCLDKKGSVFNIRESYFGNAELYHIDLSSYESVQIFNCHLQNIIPVNVKWNFNLNSYKGINSEYLRELFRQLKNVCAKNMDKISQLQFEKMEMLFYSQQLNWRKNFQDWFILKSNQISNNHGLSWTRPLFWLLGLTFIFYSIINCVSGDFSSYHIGNYLYFLLPLHSVNDLFVFKVSENPHRNWIYFWDITQKLISSYLIFQFLRAFRKYVS